MTSVADEVIEVARRLIAAPSENPPGDERRVAAVVVELLRERGLNHLKTVQDLDARPNVIVELDSGLPGPSLLLCGHTDTKPVGDRTAWTHDPFAGVIEDGRLYGLGACDMKGGIAAIIVALGRILATGGPRRGRITGALVADEEAGSGQGAGLLARSGRLRADAAIIAEPAGIQRDWEQLALGTRGSLLFRLDIDGVGGHSSLDDHLPGSTATMAMARLMTQLDAAFRQLVGVAVNVGATVAGGTFYGVRAASASMRGDVRVPPAIGYECARDLLEAEVARFAVSEKAVQVRVVLDELAVGPFEPLAIDADSAIARACREATAEVLGSLPPDGVFPAGTDSFFLQGVAGIPTVPALGPGCLREAHQPDEYVSVASLTAAPAILQGAAERYLATEVG